MKYVLLAYGNEEKFKAMSETQAAETFARCAAYDAELKATGKLIGGGSLDWASRTLRLRNGQLTVTDGPYIETKEVVGGLILIEADSFDEAVELASLHPAARIGEELNWAIELRPIEFWFMEERGAASAP